MELKQAIQERKSIRGFQKRPVSRQTLTQVLELATRAVSSKNIQPWEILVVTGRALDRLRAENIRCLEAGEPGQFPPVKMFDEGRRRQVQIGKQLFASMGIAREDKARRRWWMERGYRFFDAPAGIILCVDAELDVDMLRFDLGCLAQNICLAAMEYGLGTCVAYQPVDFDGSVRRCLGLPGRKTIICGIAIGYPDPDFPANRVVSQREDVDRVTTWYGFDGEEELPRQNPQNFENSGKIREAPLKSE